MENKTSRESETRTKKARKKDWTPPSSLDAPAASGYAHRWIRTSTAGLKTQEMYLRNFERVGNLLRPKPF